MFIFTLVTIVFLPMSSIAAIFGMNTSDIRDLDWGQGLFWAVALPTTAVVLLLAFCWPDRLPSLRSLMDHQRRPYQVAEPDYRRTAIRDRYVVPELRRIGGRASSPDRPTRTTPLSPPQAHSRRHRHGSRDHLDYDREHAYAPPRRRRSVIDSDSMSNEDETWRHPARSDSEDGRPYYYRHGKTSC